MSKHPAKSFFETYPTEYDALTDAASRARPHGREVDALIAAFSPKSVLDAGCATGLTSWLFTERGVRTIGLDKSRPMLDFARSKYAGQDEKLEFRQGQFEKLPKSLNGKFDLIVCLANAITGVGDRKGLRAALEGFGRCLQPGGTLVIQMLNYKSMAEGQLFPIKATSDGNIVYERFAERIGRRINLYVTRADLSSTPVSFEVFRHEFDNFKVDQVKEAVRKAGFTRLKAYGNLILDLPFGKSSRDLVLLAGKPAVKSH